MEDCLIIDEQRFITVPESMRKLGVQFDHNAEIVPFVCPRYWDGTDMLNMAVYINYICADKTMGSCAARNVRADDTDNNLMRFDWVVNNHITSKKGKITFLVCIKQTNSDGSLSYHWNSELNSDMHISEGLECEEDIIEKYPDIITDLLAKMNTIEIGFSNNNTKFNQLEETVNGYSAQIDQATSEAREALDRVNGDLSKQYDYYFQIGSVRPIKTPCVWIKTNN